MKAKATTTVNIDLAVLVAAGGYALTKLEIFSIVGSILTACVMAGVVFLVWALFMSQAVVKKTSQLRDRVYSRPAEEAMQVLVDEGAEIAWAQGARRRAFGRAGWLEEGRGKLFSYISAVNIILAYINGWTWMLASMIVLVLCLSYSCVQAHHICINVQAIIGRLDAGGITLIYRGEDK